MKITPGHYAALAATLNKLHASITPAVLAQIIGDEGMAEYGFLGALTDDDAKVISVPPLRRLALNAVRSLTESLPVCPSGHGLALERVPNTADWRQVPNCTECGTLLEAPQRGGYFRLSFGRTPFLGSGSHTNAVRAALRNQRGPWLRLLVELKRWWNPLPATCWTGYDEISPGVYRVEGGGPVLGLWSTDSTPEVIIKPLLPKNLRAVGVKRMTLGPEDARRESWVWVVELVEKGKRA